MQVASAKLSYDAPYADATTGATTDSVTITLSPTDGTTAALESASMLAAGGQDTSSEAGYRLAGASAGADGGTVSLVASGRASSLSGPAGTKATLGSISWTLVPEQDYAVWSADDQSLEFFHGTDVPKQGARSRTGKTASEVYTGIDELRAASKNDVPWSPHAANVMTVTLVDRVSPASTAYWFRDFSKITSIDITNLDGSRNESMRMMFYGDSKLADVVGEEVLDTSNVRDMVGTFYDCVALEKLELDMWQTGNVTAMNHMFSGADGPMAITTVGDLSGWDTSKVTDFEYFLESTLELKSIGDISHWNTGNVIEMGNMFAESGIEGSFDLSGWDTSKVTSMRSMFLANKNIVSLNLSGWDTSAVTNIAHMFDGTNIKELDIAGFDTHAVKDMTATFDSMLYLQRITLGPKFSFMGDGSAKGTLRPPSSYYIPGADGKWYDTSDWKGYTVDKVPSEKAATYVAVRDAYLMLYDRADGSRVAEFQWGDVPVASVGTPAGKYKLSLTSEAGVNPPWLNGNKVADDVKAVREVRFRDRVPVNGTRLLNGWSSLETADVSNWDTSNLTDLSYAFAQDPKLTTLTGEKGLDTSKVTDMFGTFALSTSLPEVDVTSWKTGNVTNMSFLFGSTGANGRMSLTSVGDLSGWDTSKVTNMSAMFQAANSLKTPGDLSGWQTGNVTSMRGMFNGSLTPMSITSVGDLSRWDVSKVTDMYTMFSYCSSLTSVGDLSSWQTGNVTTMAGMFQAASSLKTPGDLSGWDTSKVTDMQYMFSNCTGLTTVGDLSGWDTSKVTNMQFMFNAATGLTTLGNLSGWDTSKVTNFTAMFQGHQNKGDIQLDMRATGVESWDTSSAVYMSWMFYDCGQTTALDLSEWDVSKVRSFHHMFADNFKLESLTGLDRWKTSSLETIDGMFNDCSKLKTLDLTGWDTSKVISMDQAFERTFALETIKGLEGWDTSKVKSFSEMFEGARSIRELDLSSFSTAGVTYNEKVTFPVNTTGKVAVTEGLFNMFGNDGGTFPVTGESSPYDPMWSLRMITLGPDFDIRFDGGYAGAAPTLPELNANVAPGWDGGWYDEATGQRYAVDAIPSKKAATYVAVKPGITRAARALREVVAPEGATKSDEDARDDEGEAPAEGWAPEAEGDERFE